MSKPTINTNKGEQSPYNAKQGATMNNLQYIRDESGKALFVILPMAEYQKLAEVDEYGFNIETDGEEWQEIAIEASDNDGATIPHEVVKIKLENDVNLLGAWRIYRNLSQQEAADKLGITQAAISQMEHKQNKPQKRTLERLAKVYQCDVEQMY